MGESTTAAAPRRCYYVTGDTNPDGQYVPSLVVEGQPGHQPLDGAAWGSTLEGARAVCERTNLDTFGLTRDEVLDIVASTMWPAR